VRPPEQCHEARPWRREPREAPEALRRLERPLHGALEVVAEVRQVGDVESGRFEEHDLTSARPGDEIVRPVYLPGYRTWEHRIGHHDALTGRRERRSTATDGTLDIDLALRHTLAS